MVVGVFGDRVRWLEGRSWFLWGIEDFLFRGRKGIFELYVVLLLCVGGLSCGRRCESECMGVSFRDFIVDGDYENGSK